MNYGHRLEFGTLIQPSAGGDLVAAAKRGEQLGFDLVTLPDQPASLDAWTPLSWVAGRTERIRRRNVLDLSR